MLDLLCTTGSYVLFNTTNELPYGVTSATLKKTLNGASELAITFAYGIEAAKNIVVGQTPIMLMHGQDDILFIGRPASVEESLDGSTTITAYDLLNDLSAYVVDTNGATKYCEQYIAGGATDGNIIDYAIGILLITNGLGFWVDDTIKQKMTQKTVFAEGKTFMTIADILSAALSTYGGRFYYVYDLHANQSNQIITLTWDESYTRNNTQIISTAYNIEDVQRATSSDSLVTRAYGVGNDGMTFASINNGIPYVSNSKLEQTYGIHARIYEDEDATSPADLKSRTQKYLNRSALQLTSISITARDLNLDDDAVLKLDIGQEVRTLCPELDIDEYFPINSIEYDLLNPANTKIEQSGKRSTLTSSLGASSASSSASLMSVATKDRLGAIKVGDNLTITEDGLLSATQSGLDIQAGTAAINYDGQGAATTTVTFPREFAAVPKVFVQDNFDMVNCNVTAVSTTSFTVTVSYAGYDVKPTRTGTKNCAWVAINL